MKKPKKAKRPVHPYRPHLPQKPQKPQKPAGHPYHPHLPPRRPAPPHPYHPHLPGGGAGGGAAGGGAGGGKKKPAPHPYRPRGLPLDGVASCVAEALAASLRLTGATVGSGDVLALYRHTSDGPDAGAAILATLEAAAEFGLAGVYPVGFELVDLDDPAAQVLGVDLPGAHTVCGDGTSWWSWGQQWQPADFPDAVVEEAWQVTWCRP